MRNGADPLMTVEYDTKCMATCPTREVCARLERDGGNVSFPEDLATAKDGNVHSGYNPYIITRYAKGAAGV